MIRDPKLIDPKLRLLKAGQLAEAIGISESYVYKLLKRGDIPAVKIGRALRFDLEEVVAHLKEAA